MPQASAIITWLITYRYLIAYPIAVVEGPIVMMISGFLVRTGVFDFLPIYFILMAGDLTGDVVWYWIGRSGARSFLEKYGYILSITEENVERMEHFIRTHSGKVLFISKITMGFGFALVTLMAAGAAKVPFRKYMTINFLGQFIWTAILMGIGFFFGNLYTMVDKSLREVFVGVVIVSVALLLYGFGKFMRARFKF